MDDERVGLGAAKESYFQARQLVVSLSRINGPFRFQFGFRGPQNRDLPKQTSQDKQQIKSYNHLLKYLF